MLIKFLTRGREKGLNWKTSDGVTVKSVLYKWAERIAKERLKWGDTLYINHALFTKILAQKDLLFYQGEQWPSELIKELEDED